MDGDCHWQPSSGLSIYKHIVGYQQRSRVFAIFKNKELSVRQFIEFIYGRERYIAR
jgi:hypothetical protein